MSYYNTLFGTCLIKESYKQTSKNGHRACKAMKNIRAAKSYISCFIMQMCKKSYWIGFSTKFTQQNQMILHVILLTFLIVSYTQLPCLLLKFQAKPPNVIKGKLQDGTMTSCNDSIQYLTLQCSMPSILSFIIPLHKSLK